MPIFSKKPSQLSPHYQKFYILYIEASRTIIDNKIFFYSRWFHLSTDDLFRDILHFLGDSLGEVIIDQSGASIFNKEEKLRNLSKHLRDKYNAANFQTLYTELDTDIKNLNSTDAKEISRAFTIYLMLNNIAELVYRAIQIKNSNISSRLSSTVADLLKLYPAGEQLNQFLSDLKIQIVLTAHPTEVKRRTVLLKEKEIYQLVLKYFTEQLPIEQTQKQLNEIIESLWLTAEVRVSKPTVEDEIEAAAAFANYSLFETISDVSQEIWEELQRQTSSQVSFRPIFTVGSWPGGDKDGNPFVTVDKTRYALEYNRITAIRHYIQELDKLYEYVSVSIRRTSKLYPQLLEKIKIYLETHQNTPERLKYQSDEPFRQYVAICKLQLEEVLQETFLTTGKTLLPVEDFKQNLLLLQDALQYTGAKYLATGFLLRLNLKLDIFGFHWAALDIRQHSKVYEQLIHEIYTLIHVTDNYISLAKEKKIIFLLTSLEESRVAIFKEDLTAESRELWETFLLIQQWSQFYGDKAFGSIIISMTEDETDILEVLVLQWWSGLFDPVKKRYPRPIVPLFEMIPSLESAPYIMEALWKMPTYMKLIEQCEMRQEIMIGYSDSGKDGGFLSSQWHIHVAQKKLIAKTKEINPAIKLFFFHGRGGSVGRGGGSPITAINGLPTDANRYGMKVTEQGEVIAQKYLHDEIAHEMVLDNILGIFSSQKSTFSLSKEDHLLFDSLVSRSEKEYRRLVYNTPNFINFFEQATPVEFNSLLNVGSRPSKRQSGSTRIEDLRAIPWIFAWTQNRLLLPVWFGSGRAFEDELNDQVKLAKVRSWLKDWSFFVALIDNLETQLLKVDMNSARKYASLSSSVDLFPQMFEEYFRIRRMIRRITQEKHLLLNNPFLKKAIEARIPYMDPLTLIQVDAIKYYRDKHDTDNLELILLTINGIVAGMKNTG